MANSTKKSQDMATISNKLNEYREHLKYITKELVESAKAAGRTKFTTNQLLRESYNIVDADLDTFDGWKSRGAQVKKGEHGYLFWGTPIAKENYTFFPLSFRFTRQQVFFPGAIK